MYNKRKTKSHNLLQQPTYIIQESDHIHRLYSDDLAPADVEAVEGQPVSDPNLPTTRKNFQISESLAGISSIARSSSLDIPPKKSKNSKTSLPSTPIQPSPTKSDNFHHHHHLSTITPRPCRCPISTLTTPALATDFVFAPLTLERLIVTGFLLCLDSLLFMCTILPLRFLLALSTVLRNPVIRLLRFFRCRKFRRLRTVKLHPIQKIDLFRILLMLSAFIFLQKVEVSFFIAFIKKGLSKMRMMVMFVEVIERVLIDFGSTILGSSFWRLSKAETSVWRFIGMYILGSIYLAIHSSFLLFHLCILDVSVSLGSNALISLMVLIQFAEMKGDVLKKHTCDKLTSIVYGDIVERFQTTALLVILFCSKYYEHYNQPDAWVHLSPLVSGIFTVYISELLTDWIKHMSICNYSGLSPHIYTDLGSKALKNLSRTHTTSILTDRSYSVCREIGMFAPALALLILRVTYDIQQKMGLRLRGTVLFFAGSFAVLFLLKWATFKALRRLSKVHKVYRRLQKIPSLRTNVSANFYKLLLIKPPNYKEAILEHKTSKTESK